MDIPAMPAALLLAANEGEWIKIAVGVVVFLIYLANHLLGGKNKAAQPPAKRQAPRRPATPPAAGRPAQGQAAGRGNESLSAEIEQFLKEAAQRKRDKGRRDVPNRPAAAPVAKSRPSQPIRRLVEQPLDVEVIEPPMGQSMAKAVERDLDTRDFAIRASHMTDEIKRGDAERAEHFKRQFTHRVGRLQDTSAQQGDESVAAATDSDTPTAANEFAILLANPAGVRQAIILNELLQRPESRW